MFSRMPKLKCQLLCFLAIVISSIQVTAGTDQNQAEYSFGVVPQQSATTLAENWVPIFQYISAKTGLKIRFRTARDIPTFESRVAAGEYDFAYMNPFHYVTYHANPGYQAFANQSHKKIRGIMVKAKDSSIDSLSDLSGETLAFPSPAAFAASLLPRGELNREGIPITPKYVGSHDSVYRSVAKGLFPAGGGIERTFNTLRPEIRGQLEIWWTSEGYTPHSFAAHPRISRQVVNQVAAAMIAMEQDPEGIALLARIKFKGIQRAVNVDWDDVRRLGLLPDQTGVVR